MMPPTENEELEQLQREIDDLFDMSKPFAGDTGSYEFRASYWREWVARKSLDEAWRERDRKRRREYNRNARLAKKMAANGS